MFDSHPFVDFYLYFGVDQILDSYSILKYDPWAYGDYGVI